MRCFPSLALLATVLFSTVTNATPFTLDLLDGTAKSTATPEQVDASSYRFTPDLAVAISQVQVHIPASEISVIERRITTYTAIGDDGPWLQIHGIEAKSRWEKLSHRANKTGVVIELSDVQMATWAQPEASASAIIAALKASRDFKTIDEAGQSHWLTMAATCTSPTTGSCYTYPGVDTLRITKHDGSKLILTIDYPGGC